MDINDISGFISKVSNVAYLRDLHAHIAERIAALGFKPSSKPLPLRDPHPKSPEEADALESVLEAQGDISALSSEVAQQRRQAMVMPDKTLVHSNKPTEDYSSFPPALAIMIQQAQANRGEPC